LILNTFRLHKKINGYSKFFKNCIAHGGIALVNFGLYSVFAPDAIIDARPIQEKAANNRLDTQSIVLIALGVLALLTTMF
jgi:hypothetical protein